MNNAQREPLQRVPMTVEGEKKLLAEVHHLKSVERPRVIAAIAEARAHGDLRENAEYHAAREQQSFIEGRIGEIEAKLAVAQVIDVTAMPKTGKVIFGVTVELINTSDDSKVTYQIVGDDEANIKAGKIAISTPLARAIIGKEEGDVVVVKIPSGEVEYEIAAVKYL
jgi:transcription elongation factor GreA